MDKENDEIDIAWVSLEYSGYIKKIREMTIDKGPGMAIFKFSATKQTYNCENYYATKDSYFWEEIFKEADMYGKKLFEDYDPVKHLFLYIQLPMDDSTYTGSLRLYTDSSKNSIITCVSDSRTVV